MNLYYIFNENLTLNRSFVLELLKGFARQMMIKMSSCSERDGFVTLENTDKFWIGYVLCTGKNIAKLSYAKPNSEPQFLIS